MKNSWISLLWMSLCIAPTMAQSVIHPDSVEQAWEELDRRREEAKRQMNPVGLVQLGVWKDGLDTALSQCSFQDSLVARAWQHYLSADFSRAGWICDAYSPEIPREFNQKMSILLAMKRWDLAEAKRQILEGFNKELPEVWLAYQQGKIGLWEKKYESVLTEADSLVKVYPNESLAWLLKAEAAFWLLDLELAEQALVECLKLDPFNADARFWYGYVIWRKRDASLLDDMAAQWELALAIHPLHFLTHWHWGNGHTNLTYADYADPDEEMIRNQLAIVDSLEGINNRDAFTILTQTQNHYPESVIPDLYLASVIYQMVFQNPRADVIPELDPDAFLSFQKILQQKPHYGPAYNGLAAVLKQKQIRYLAAYDSLEQVIAETVIERPESFYSVFPDVKRYPGDRVAKMVYGQLHTGVAYLEMLDTLNRTFAIPPLHEDLAIAMDNPWFRGATTFDNRQWMDIRGVGSGATGIEYVERGSHLERNVTLHEYVHLFHGTVFTDREQRRIRDLYTQAMANDYTLDYYARNNEYEYFAQGFPAYFSTIKVHPLNHKSVNTRADLMEKDPDLFAFIDSLVQKQQAWLDGDSSALAANWAQTYLRLVDQAMIHDDLAGAQQYLDRAFAWDSSYLPVYLAQVRLAATRTYWAEAERWLDKAEAQFPGSAAVQMARADHAITLFRSGLQSDREAVAAYFSAFRKAQQLDSDPLLKAEWQAEFRQTMSRFARWDLLVNETESYLATADTTSTYLQELRDDALADLAWVKGMMGYGAEADSLFSSLIRRKPQEPGFRKQYAEVLLSLDRQEAAKAVLEEIREIYTASENADPGLDILWLQATTDSALLAEYLGRERIPAAGREYWYRAQVVSRDSVRTAEWTAQLPEARYPSDQAERYLSLAIWQGMNDDWGGFEYSLRQSIAANPFHLEARTHLISYLMDNDRQAEAVLISREGQLLPITPGPDAPDWTRMEMPEGGEE